MTGNWFSFKSMALPVSKVQNLPEEGILLDSLRVCQQVVRHSWSNPADLLQGNTGQDCNAF